MKYFLRIFVVAALIVMASPSWASNQENNTKTNQATKNIKNNADPQATTDNTKETAISQNSPEPKKQEESPLLIGINKIATSLDQISKSNNSIVLWVQVFVFVLQLFVFGWQGIQLKRSVDLNRAWVFAGCGGTELVRPGVVRLHPDHRNNGASPAFVEYVFIDFLSANKPLPESPPYKTKYSIVNPLQPDKTHESIFRQGWMEQEMSEDMYVFGRIYYHDAFRRKGTQRYSSFIYLIKMELKGDHIRPLPDEVPTEYWKWT